MPFTGFQLLNTGFISSEVMELTSDRAQQTKVKGLYYTWRYLQKILLSLAKMYFAKADIIFFFILNSDVKLKESGYTSFQTINPWELRKKLPYLASPVLFWV